MGGREKKGKGEGDISNFNYRFAVFSPKEPSCGNAVRTPPFYRFGGRIHTPTKQVSSLRCSEILEQRTMNVDVPYTKSTTVETV